ncbi:hypothetical protein MRX96_041337 [Rhipicephalus microplus]
MALYHRSSEKRRIFNDFRRQEEEVIGSLVSRLSNRPTSPKTQMEQEKRIRREIANSNERRRMQSINAGFQSLRTLLPHHDGEKLSKVSLPVLLFLSSLLPHYASSSSFSRVFEPVSSCAVGVPDRCRVHLALPPGGIVPLSDVEVPPSQFFFLPLVLRSPACCPVPRV